MHPAVKKILWIFVLACPLWGVSAPVTARNPSGPDGDATRIQALKSDARGPFQSIQWYCPDGKILPAKERCASPGGRQHGRLKDWVADLARKRHIFLNVVLSGADPFAVWDEKTFQSRLKQYALVQYLIQADQGWIYRQARYYRGAVQAEDESAWGKSFLDWLLGDTERLKTSFFQVREACRT
ncbi:MAG TPA: hypothetical protein DHV36_15960, partial [Desulfobacteraceae bacterium]|nr:hypothetical protein [Desulfobacteraceae bacterium]